MPTITDRTRKRLSQKQLRNQCRASRRQQARKARASRRQIDRIHDQLPKQVRAVFDPVEPAFTHPTHHRLVFLALAAILIVGRTTTLGREIRPESEDSLDAVTPLEYPLQGWEALPMKTDPPKLHGDIDC